MYVHRILEEAVWPYVDRKEVISIIGPRQAGKTTFIDCLLGIKPITSGSILFNGNSIDKYSLQSIRQHVAYVGQSAELFTGSVLRNIDIADKHERLHVEHILALVGLDTERIHELGLSTNIGENGNAFSGGEGQRLIVARALLSSAPVLIFDEATSAVDPETEQRIMQYLQSTKDERICIIISHRLQTISYADQVLVLDKGVIAERGTVVELSSRGTRFSKLFSI